MAESSRPHAEPQDTAWPAHLPAQRFTFMINIVRHLVGGNPDGVAINMADALVRGAPDRVVIGAVGEAWPGGPTADEWAGVLARVRAECRRSHGTSWEAGAAFEPIARRLLADQVVEHMVRLGRASPGGPGVVPPPPTVEPPATVRGPSDEIVLLVGEAEDGCLTLNSERVEDADGKRASRPLTSERQEGRALLELADGKEVRLSEASIKKLNAILGRQRTRVKVFRRKNGTLGTAARHGSGRVRLERVPAKP